MVPKKSATPIFAVFCISGQWHDMNDMYVNFPSIFFFTNKKTSYFLWLTVMPRFSCPLGHEKRGKSADGGPETINILTYSIRTQVVGLRKLLYAFSDPLQSYVFPVCVQGGCFALIRMFQ
jgi:hypothetical protein